jgi:hypothetical protein
VGVGDPEGHPVPVGQWDRALPTVALVVADDRDRAAHPGYLTGGGEGRLRPGDLERHVAPAPIGERLNDIVERLLRHIDDVGRSQVLCPFQRVRAGIGDDQVARTTQGDQLLDKIAHEAGADDDDVVTELRIGHLDGVDGAGDRFRQGQIERDIAGRVAP